MGGLSWDRSRFPDPEQKIASYGRDGLGVIALLRERGGSNRDAAAFWHDELRQRNIIRAGVIDHWTDLGPPRRGTSRSRS